jgi:hypothetical protein
MDERGTGSNKGVGSLENTLFHHDTVNVDKYIIDETLPATAGFSTVEIRGRQALVQ